ncbi:hypothetical protein [Providencia sp.]|uniref:hypothetical protein n=1 Tax=Providencia sp. TaxID=589 RepID=UPI00333F2C15
MKTKISPIIIKIPRANICNTNQKTNSTLGNSAKSITNSSTPLPIKPILKSGDNHQNSVAKKHVSFNLPAQETTMKSANAGVKTNEPVTTVKPPKVTTEDLDVLSREISKIKSSIHKLMTGKASWKSAQEITDISDSLRDIKNKIQDFSPRIESNMTRGQSAKLKKLESFEKRMQKRQDELKPLQKKNNYENSASNNYAKSRQENVESINKSKTAKLTEHH